MTIKEMNAYQRKEERLSGWLAILHTWRDHLHLVMDDDPEGVSPEQYIRGLEARIQKLETNIRGVIVLNQN